MFGHENPTFLESQEACFKLVDEAFEKALKDYGIMAVIKVGVKESAGRMVTWTSGGIERSTSVYVNEFNDPTKAVVEINAWRSIPATGRPKSRDWQHKIIGTIDLMSLTAMDAQVSQLIGEAFTNVTQWDISSLSQHQDY